MPNPIAKMDVVCVFEVAATTAAGGMEKGSVSVDMVCLSPIP